MPNFAELENNIIVNVIESNAAPSVGQWIEITDSNKEIGTDEDGNVAYFEAGIGSIFNSSTGRFESPPNLEQNVDEATVRLKASDWTVLPDVGLTSANVELWKTYRSTLRSIIRNRQEGDISWPEPPDEEYV